MTTLILRAECFYIALFVKYMEPMDIQAGRRNTAEQRERAEKAEENTIKVLIESLQEVGLSKEAVVTKVMEKLDFSETMALEKVERYWKE